MNVSKIFNQIKKFICNKKANAKIEPENKLTRDIVNKVKKYDKGRNELTIRNPSQLGNIIVYRSRRNLHMEKIEKIRPIEEKDEEEVKEEPIEKIENNDEISIRR